jgi:predicted  nucleic acid-binding Zn-ribbon protein
MKGLGSYGAKGMFITPTMGESDLNLAGISNQIECLKIQVEVLIRDTEVRLSSRLDALDALHKKLSLETDAVTSSLVDFRKESSEESSLISGNLRELGAHATGQLTALEERLENRLHEAESKTLTSMLETLTETESRLSGRLGKLDKNSLALHEEVQSVVSELRSYQRGSIEEAEFIHKRLESSEAKTTEQFIVLAEYLETRLNVIESKTFLAVLGRMWKRLK